MRDIESSSALRPADEISSDLHAIRELDDTEWRLGWSRQFALILVFVTAFVILVWLGMSKRSSIDPIVFNGGITVATDFASGAWIATALEQALVTTVQAGEQVRLINSRQPGKAFSRYGLASGVARQSGAQWILNAVITKGQVESATAIVSLQLRRVDDAAPTYSADVIGSTISIGDLAIRSAEQLYAWLELDGLTGRQLGFAKSEIPSAAASEAYGKGLSALAESNGRAALGFFQDANLLAPNSAAIHEGLGRAWELLGYAENAANEAKLAMEAGGGLSRRRQLELEAQFALRTEAWPRAQQVFGALKEFNPEDLDYRLALAETQANQNNADGFLESIAQMRALPGTVGADPRIDLTESWYWFNTGDYARCQSLARAAQGKARQSGNRHLLGRALMGIGRCDDTYDPTVLLTARKLFTELNSSMREPEILRELAKHEFAKGNMPQYLAYLEEAVALSRELGNEPQLAASNNSLAQAYDLHGWLERGYALKKEIAEYQKQRANLSRYAILLENIAVSLFKMGRYQEALEVSEQAEPVFIDVDDKIGIAWLPYRRGQIALRRGDLDNAKTLMQQAFVNAEERPEGNLAVEASYELGLSSLFSGDYEDAAAKLAEANRFYREKGLSASTAESEIALARLNFQLQDTAAAVEHLNTAEELLASEAGYYALSLRAEQLHFGLLVSDEERRHACRQLEQQLQGQEHMEYVLRATIKVVACRFLVDGQPLPVVEAQLLDVEQRARALESFDALLAAGYLRAALLAASGRHDDAQAEDARVRRVAAAKDWQAHPMPDLDLQMSSKDGPAP